MPYAVLDERRTGVTSVYSHPNGKYSSIDQAIAAAFSNSNHVRILDSGVMAAGVETPRSNMIVEVLRGVVLTNATSGSNGMFKFTGDNITLTGGGMILIQDGNWVDNQVVIEFSGGDSILVDAMYFQAGKDSVNSGAADSEVGGEITDSDTDNPMVMLKCTGTSNVIVRHNFFHPGQAVRMLEGSQDHGLIIQGNQFTNTDHRGLDASGDGLPSPRHGFQMILCTGTDWGQLLNNRFWGIGDPTDLILQTANTPEFAFRLIGAGVVGNEQGHWIVQGNTCETFCADNAFQFWGAISVNVQGNLFGFQGLVANTPSAAGEGPFKLTGDDGTSSGQPCDSVIFEGNDIHNPGSGDAAAIFIERGTNIVIAGNAFLAQASNNTIRCGSGGTGTVQIAGNTFQRATASSSHYPVHIASGSFSGKMIIGGNLAVNYTGDFLDNDSTGGTINAIGLQDTTTGDVPDSGSNINEITTNIQE